MPESHSKTAPTKRVHCTRTSQRVYSLCAPGTMRNLVIVVAPFGAYSNGLAGYTLT